MNSSTLGTTSADLLAECDVLYDWTINLTLHETKDLKYVPPPGGSTGFAGINLASLTGASPVEPLPNQWLCAKLGTQAHETTVRAACSGSAYDYHGNFAIKATLRDFGYHLLEIQAFHQVNVMIRSSQIGRIAVSPRAIYERASHSIVRAWIDFINLADPTLDVGSLCLSVTVVCTTLADRQSLTQSLAPAAVDPISGERHFYALLISIFKGQDIIPTFTALGQSLSEPFVEVMHGVNRQTTRVVSLNANPDWNTQITMMSTSPGLDDYVRISLWNGKVAPTLYGVCLLPVQSIILSGQLLFWIYFYTNDLAMTGTLSDIVASGDYLQSLAHEAISSIATGASGNETMLSDWESMTVVSNWDTTPKQTIGISTYAGRVLCHATAKTVHAPFKTTIATCGMVQPPPTSAYDLHSQVFEIASTQEDIGPLKVEVCCGPHQSISSAVTCQSTGKGSSYRFENSEGQMMPLRLMIDQAMTNSWGVLLYVTSPNNSAPLAASNAVFGNSNNSAVTNRRIAVTYLGLDQVLRMDEKPSWIGIQTADTRVDVFKILIRLVLRPAVEGNAVAPLAKAYDTCRYVFRCFIYEAVNLKCPSNSNNELPTPYIKCELAGTAWTTKEIYHARNPLIFQAFESVLTLPDDLNLADNIVISVYHKNQNSMDTLAENISVNILAAASVFSSSTADELLGRMEYSIKKVPKVWDRLPEWLSLTPEDSGAVLCAFELLYPEEVESYPFYQDLRPSTYACTVVLTILGIVSHWPLSMPRVKISYGRDLRDSKVALWSTFTTAVASESSKNKSGFSAVSSSWIFNQNIQVGLELPKRSVHFAYLEIEVYHENSYSQPLLTGIIPLSDIIPWYQLYEIEILSGRFCQSYIGPGGRQKRQSAAELGASTSLEDDSQTVGGKLMTSDFNSTVKIDWRFISPETADLRHLDPPGRDMGQEADFWINADADAHATGRDARRVATVHNVNINKLMFNLKAEEELALTEDEKRETISAPIESILDLSLLPYRLAELISPTPNDHPVIVGQLKYLAHITPVDQRNDNTRSSGKQEFQRMRKLAANLVQDSIETRIYCLHARELVSSDAVGASLQFYLILDFPGVDQNSRSENTCVVDRANPRGGTLDPIFNKCYSFLVDLPQMACLRIRVMQMGTLQDEEVGSTYINLETLWWSEQYREMVENYTLPVETRILRKFETSNLVNELLMTTQNPRSVATGNLSLWIDMLSTQSAQARPISILSSPDPQPYQLRIVIWQLKNCKMGNASSISLLVSGSFRHVDDTLDVQWTDTHYNSRDGRAVFNWRFVFDIYIPARFSSLTLAVHQHAVIGTGDLLGNCIIDLQRDFTITQRSHGTEHEISRSWINLNNPKEPNVVQGELEYQISVLSQKDAASQPVGKGREEPNKNPYLEPVLENRNYVDWQGWTDSLKELGLSIAWTTKWLLIVIVVVIVLASILWLVLALK